MLDHHVAAAGAAEPTRCAGGEDARAYRSCCTALKRRTACIACCRQHAPGDKVQDTSLSGRSSRRAASLGRLEHNNAFLIACGLILRLQRASAIVLAVHPGERCGHSVRLIVSRRLHGYLTLMSGLVGRPWSTLML